MEIFLAAPITVQEQNAARSTPMLVGRIQCSRAEVKNLLVWGPLPVEDELLERSWGVKDPGSPHNALNARNSVKSRVKRQDLLNAMPFHYGKMYGIARRVALA